jgi:hypothetical protein
MTPYMNPLAINGLAGRWPALPKRDAVGPRSRLGVRPQRLTARLLVVVAFEALVLLGTFQVMAGIGQEAQAGWAPTPGGVAPAAPPAPPAELR